MKAFFKKKPVTKKRDVFRVEALEARVLLSADPVLGAVQVVTSPDTVQQSTTDQAYDPAQQTDMTTTVTDVPLTTTDTSTATTTTSTPSTSTTTDTTSTSTTSTTDTTSTTMFAPMQTMSLMAAPMTTTTTTTTISGSYFSTNASATGDLLIDDNVVIDGNVTFTGGTSGSGGVQLGTSSAQKLDGNGDTSPDNLTIVAPGYVEFYGPIGRNDPLESLTINGSNGNMPDGVTFHNDVKIDGNLIIHTTGVVTFESTLTLGSGGGLQIYGATEVIFNSGLKTNGGNILIEGDEISFYGGNESVVGTGLLTLRPSTPTLDMEIGSVPVNSHTAATLNIDATELRTFADGFSKIVFGRESGGHAEATAGHVDFGANNLDTSATLRDNVEVYGGSITVVDLLQSSQKLTINGTVKLDAVNDIVIENTLEARIGTTLQDVTLYSAHGAISQIDDLDDGASAELLRANNLNVHADQGIHLNWMETGTVTAVNTGLSGDIVMHEAAAGAGLRIYSVSQSNASGMGGIDLASAAGAVDIDNPLGSSGIFIAGHGSLAVTAGGTGSQVHVYDAIVTQDGGISLTAPGAVTVQDDATYDGTLTSNGGAISLSSTTAQVQLSGDVTSAGGHVTATAQSFIAMADGKSVSALNAGHTGDVDFTAGTLIKLATINADRHIGLTAQSGDITNILSNSGSFNLDGDTASVTLAATAGIGASAAALHTRIDSLAATNTASGSLFINEATALRLTGSGAYAVDLAGAGANVVVTTASGNLSVEKAIRSTGTTGTAGQIGNILLKAGGVGSVLTAGANISSTSGNISMLSAGNVSLGATQVQTSAAGATIDIDAAQAVVMGSGASLQTNNGNIVVNASGGDVTLGILTAGQGNVRVAASGSILDAQADDTLTPRVVNVAANGLQLQAGSAVGAAGAALETQVSTLAMANGTGSAYVQEADGLSIGNVANVQVKRVAQDATAALMAGAGSLAGLAGGQPVALQSGGNLSLDSQMQVTTGHLLLNAIGTLSINSGITLGGGSLSLLASGLISQAAGVALNVTGGTIDVQSSSGGITMAGTASALTNSGNIRYSAAGNIALGQLDARAGADRTAGTLTNQNTWGAVSVTSGGAITTAGNGTNVQASSLRLFATSGVGSTSAQLLTEVATLSANAGTGSLYLTETSAVTVGQTAAVTVDRVKADGTITGSSVTDAVQSNLTAGGQLSLTATGSITTQATGAITGSTGVLLQTLGANADVALGAAVNAAGLTDIRATRDIVMADGVAVTSTAADVSLTAGGSVTLETLSAELGKVSVTATQGSIVDLDTAGDSEVDIVAANVVLTAGNAIGAGINAIETTAGTLTATAGAGGLFITETDLLTVNGLTTTAGDGAIVLRTLAGDMTLNGPVSAHGNGNVLLNASGALTQNGTIGSSGGSISLAASGTLTQNANIATTGSGTVDVAAQSIAMGATAVTTASANVRYAANAGLAVGAIVTTGNVALSAGTITDAGDTETDISAVGLILSTTTGGAGDSANPLEISVDTLAANVAGGLYLKESNDIALNAVATVAVNRVATDGTLGSAATTGISDLHTGGAFVLETVAGSIVATDGDADGSAVASGGNLLLKAGGVAADISLNGAVTAAGNLTLQAGRDVHQLANVSTTVSGKSAELLAGRAIVMEDGTRVATVNGNIALTAATDVTVETLNAGSGNVSVTATGGSIFDQDPASDTAADIVAAGVRLMAGNAIGAGGNAIETSAVTLAASAGSGGLFITETDAVSINSVSVAVNHVGTDGNTAAATAALAGLATGAGGHIVVSNTNGNITVDNNVVAGSLGNVLVKAAANLTQNAAISSAGGNISLGAGAAYAQKANLTTSGGGTIDVTAGTIAMDNGTLTSNAANIRYAATAAGTGNITLGAISTSGNVSLSGVSINKNTLNDTDIDVTASQLRLTTTTGRAGDTALPLKLAVGTLAADIGGGLYLLESDDVTIDTVNAIQVQRVATDGTAATTAGDAALSDLHTTGNLVLRTTAGSITVNEGSANSTGIQAGGNLLLETGGANADITINANVNGTSNLSIHAARDLVQAAAIRAQASAMTIDVTAGRNIGMADGAQVVSTDGNVALVAGNNVTIETVSAGLASARVAATAGSILDQDNAGDSEVDITANSVVLTAATGIGSGGNAIETTVARLSAKAGSGGMFLTESDGLTVAGNLAVQVNQVSSAGTIVATTTAAQSGLATQSDGAIVLKNSSGDIVVGANVTAGGAGSILLSSVGAVTVNNAVSSGSGNVSIAAGTTFTQNQLVSTGGSGTIDVTANAIAMSDSGIAQSIGNIRYVSATTMTVGSFTTLANVSLKAASLSDSGTTDIDVIAHQLNVTTTSGGAGAADKFLQTRVDTLAANVAGGLYLTEADALAVDAVDAITVHRVNADGSASDVTDAATADVRGVDVLLSTLAGSLFVNDGDGNQAGIVASGNLLLATAGTLSNIALGANAHIKANGNITLQAAYDLLQSADIRALSTSSTIDVQAGRNIAMADGAIASSNGGGIRYEAISGDVSLGQLDARTVSDRGAGILTNQTAWGSVSIVAGGYIIDSTESQVTIDVYANQLRMAAGNSIGSIGSIGASGDAIETEAAVLSAAASGSLNLAEQSTLTVGSTSALTVKHVGSTGVLSDRTDLAQVNVTAAGDIHLSTGIDLLQSGAIRSTIAAGSVTLTAGGAIAMANNTITSTVDGGIALTAGTDATIETLSAGAGAITVTATLGSILDQDTAGDTEADMLGGSLTLAAGTGIGSVANRLETAVSSVTANAGAGGIFLAESNDLDTGLLNTSGALAVSAGGTLRMHAKAGAGGSATLWAQGAFTQDDGTRITASALTLTTVVGDITLAGISAQDMNVQAGGSILNGAASGANLSGATARLQAQGAIGAGDRHLTTAIDTLTSAASGTGIYLTETNAVTLGASGQTALSATSGNIVVVNQAGDLTLAGTVDGDGNILLKAGSDGLQINGDIHGGVRGGSGNISLQAGGVLNQRADIATTGTLDVQAGGTLAMTDHTSSEAHDIRYQSDYDVQVAQLMTDGKVSLVAGGAILDAQTDSDTSFNVTAGGLRLQAGSGIGTAARPLQIVTDALSAHTTSGDIHLEARGDLTVTGDGVGVTVQRVDQSGHLATVSDNTQYSVISDKGNNYLTSLDGKVVFDQPVSGGSEQDVSIVGNAVSITQPVSGDGGQLLVKPSDPSVSIQIGGTSAAAGTLHLDNASLSQIQGGFAQVVIGGGDAAPGQDITILGTDTPVVFSDPLLLNVNGAGSQIHIEGNLTAQAVTATANVEIDGSTVINAGAGGDLVFQQAIDGVDNGNDDVLTLAASGGNVTVAGAVGGSTALHGMNVTGARDVTFQQNVTLNGDMTIDATGVVRFDNPLAISGGTLTIRGAQSVVIGDLVLNGQDGPIVIEANQIQLNGDMQGEGAVVLRGTETAQAIVVGSAPASGNALVIGTDTLSHLQTMSSIVIGTQGADGHAQAGSGSVTLGALDTRQAMGVYGSTVAVQGTLTGSSGIALDGVNGVQVNSNIASDTGDVSLHSGTGGVSMDAGTAITASGRIDIQGSGSLNIAQLRADTVALRSENGMVTDARHDGTADIIADTVSIYGKGTVVGSGNGDALEVDAKSIYVGSPTGVVMQDTGPDNKTHFYVLDGAEMREIATGIGSISRVVNDPTVVAPQPQFAGLSVLPTSMMSVLPMSMTALPSLNSGVSSYLTLGGASPDSLSLDSGSGTLEASSLGLGSQLNPSFTLGSSGQQSLATGQLANGDASFDYWMEDLVV